VVVVPFPFTDRSEVKRRPALVLGKASFNRHGHTMRAMITSAAHHPWPGDTAVTQQQAAGLRGPCVVRLKVFTLDSRLIAQVIGRLAAADRKAVGENLRRYVA
jgi:mRNA interferase MazF